MRLVPRRLAALFAAFVMLGLPEGVLGTAWPTMRSSLDQPESALARLIIAYTVGYLVATALLGRIVDRLGSDATIRTGMGLTVAGLAGCHQGRLGSVVSPGSSMPAVVAGAAASPSAFSPFASLFSMRF